MASVVQGVLLFVLAPAGVGMARSMADKDSGEFTAMASFTRVRPRAAQIGNAPIVREPTGLRAALRAWSLGLPRVMHRLARALPLQECWLCRGVSHGALLCAFCRRALPRCSAPTAAHRLARDCGLDALRVRHDYRFPMDVLITRYKYAGELALARPLAKLAAAPPPWPAGIGEPCLLPVPASDQRVRARGFDAMAVLGRHYARRFSLPCLPGVRRRPTPAQAGLARDARRANLHGAFVVPRLQQGVVLFDDVLTTGATLGALAAACREGGAPWVAAVVLARTPGPEELLVED